MHDEWTDRLSAYLDGELDRSERARVDEHLSRCDDCRRTLAELRGVVRWAAGWQGDPAPPDPWPAIRARIDAERVVELPVARPSRRDRFGWRHLIAAGLLMAAAGAGGAWWLAGNPAPLPPAGGAVDEPAPVLAAASPADVTIRDLEVLLASGRSGLDTATVRVVEQSLRLIDDAIAEARAAVQRDSTNAYLNSRIAAHMRQKLAILRMATRALGAES